MNFSKWSIATPKGKENYIYTYIYIYIYMITYSRSNRLWNSSFKKEKKKRKDYEIG